jgi:hypothetical protein
MASRPTRAIGASASQDDSKFLWLPDDTAKTADFLRGANFADARERFIISPARTFFSFSGGKRRVLLLRGRETICEGDIKGLREDVREGRILMLPLKLLDFGGERLPRIFNTHAHVHTRTHDCNSNNKRKSNINNGSRSRNKSCRWSNIIIIAAASPFLPFSGNLYMAVHGSPISLPISTLS